MNKEQIYKEYENVVRIEIENNSIEYSIILSSIFKNVIKTKRGTIRKSFCSKIFSSSKNITQKSNIDNLKIL